MILWQSAHPSPHNYAVAAWQAPAVYYDIFPLPPAVALDRSLAFPVPFTAIRSVQRSTSTQVPRSRAERANLPTAKLLVKENKALDFLFFF